MKTPDYFRFRWLAAWLLLTSMAGELPAARISWEAALNLTQVSDLITGGRLVRAVNVTRDAISPTVTAGAETIVFEAEALGPLGVGTGNYFTGDGGDTGDENLNTVLNSHGWGSEAWNFELGGLTAGRTYRIQLIGAGDTRSCCSNRNQRAGDGEAAESVSNDFSRSGVGSVIGTFTADGPTQQIRMLPGLVNGTDPGLSGYVLRETTPPAPSAPTDIALSNPLVPPGAPEGFVIGLLSATDPDAGDSVTVTLASTAEFPDQAIFTVAGRELRLAAPAAAPGQSYQIRLRATDSTGLSFEKSFVLTVQPVQPPVSVALSRVAIPANTPAGTAIGTLSTTDPTVGDLHAYSLVPGAGDADNQRFVVDGATLRMAGALELTGGTLSVRVRTTDLAGQSLDEVIMFPVVNLALRLNEFLANSTAATLKDEDGDTTDWIELHNSSAAAVNLAGWGLTDDPLIPHKWRLPEAVLPAGGYRIVFASGKNRAPATGNWHANFRLDAGGDWLALVSPTGHVVSEFGAGGTRFPRQRAGISYGFYGTPVQIGYMLTPTPGAANNAASGVPGLVEDTRFSVNRGFHEAPFELAITSDTPGATIRYTTDGSWPAENTGTLYTGPFLVDRTMPVKAIATKPGFLPTDVDTHTYLFVKDIVTQTPATVQSVYEFPSTWKGTPAYYGLNGNSTVVNPASHPTLKDDLKTVPSLSIVLATGDMFGNNGIYSNPTSAGAAWERKTSLELIDPAAPDGSRNFQENAVIQIQGGAFRDFGLSRKKSFRITMKPDYGTANQPTGGPGRLNFPLFGTDAAQSFNTFTLRMESNDGWQWSGAGGKPQYARDQFARRAMQELGQPASAGRYLHVYINGVYWGVYNAVERPDASFAENYLGADPALWQGQNSGQPINAAANLADWNTMLGAVDDISSMATAATRDAEYLEAAGFRPDGARKPAVPVWIDPTNFADYLLVNWYAGNSDWPFKNYYAGRAREPGSTGFKFFVWDCEWSLLLQSSPTTNRTGDFSGIAGPQAHLEKSPEYRLRFADRAFRALLNDGPLTPTRGRALYDEITHQHRSILIPESARWGNQHGGRYGIAQWQQEYTSIVNSWFPVRSGNLLGQLRTRGLYPAIDAPLFSQRGGPLADGTLTLSAPSAVSRIYFRHGPGDSDATDYAHSLDPRLVGGGIHPEATLVELSGGGGGTVTTTFVNTGAVWKFLADGSNQGTAWQKPGFDDASWPSGPSPLGYGDGDEATDVGFVDADPVATGVQRNATTYFRRVVDIPDPSVFADFTLTTVYDDAIVVYVNGVAVELQNLSADPPHDQYTATSPDNATTSRTLAPSVFRPGANTVAAEVHQGGSNSSDISFDLTLTGNPPGGGNTLTSAPITLPGPGWVLARSYDSATGTWSALNSAFFTVNTVPASASNLAIPELHYHPAPPPAGASVADADEYEFVELLNLSPTLSVDLTGAAFTSGITFEFAANSLIPPGGRVVVVRNEAAFQDRYAGRLDGVTLARNTAGSPVYGGRLDNLGETVTLLAADGSPITRFRYGNSLPWPAAAAGAGSSLVLARPASPPPDPDVAANWIASRTLHGTPGKPEPAGFLGDPAADLDGDGFNALLEYALGTSEATAGDALSRVSASLEPFPPGATESFLSIRFRSRQDDPPTVIMRPEISDDLVTWRGDATLVLVSTDPHGDGTATVRYRSGAPATASGTQFIRLRATLPP